MSQANEIQVGGAHYKCSIQHWDLIWQYYGIGYFIGNITKYITRAHKKNGAQDLDKARHYCQKLIELLEAQSQPLIYNLGPVALLGEYCAANKLCRHQQVLLTLVFGARSSSDLYQVVELLEHAPFVQDILNHKEDDIPYED